MGKRTKQMIAEKFQQMARHRAIKDIQVKELCRECGIERTTFYYHFYDKYELISWIFEQMFFEESQQADIINSEEMILRMAYRLQQKKDFFANALQDDSQNNLRQYMLDFYIQSEESILKQYLNVNQLDEDLTYTIRAYSYGCMGLTIEWLLNKINLTPETFAHHQYRLMPQILKEAYRNHSGDAFNTRLLFSGM